MSRSSKFAWRLSIIVFVANDPASGEGPLQDGGNAVEATLNGLSILIDSGTGSILKLVYQGPGKLMDTDSGSAGLLDLAYPIEAFEPLRLASRYSQGARITKTNNTVTISWEKLGASRSFDLPGGVSAIVQLKAAPDGRSVIFTCEIENRADRSVRQVLFPDLAGLVPFAGEDETEFRTAGFVSKPFRELRLSGRDRFYATDSSFAEYKAGSLLTPMVLRWMDLGGLRGGFSLFPRRWGWDPQTTVMLHRSEANGKLRLICLHDVEIKPGDKWASGEFWLTPHKNGWAKGIEPYRQWARKHIRRKYPVPDHVRNGLGFRSIWMCQNQPNDPADAIWKFRDLVPLARQAKVHGLTEMVLWVWHRSFALPFPPPYSHLGTEQELIEAVKECKRLGVNVAPFVSVLQADKTTATRYGLTIRPGSGNWSYHTELIPRFNPRYASNFACVQVDTTNPKWQEDVLNSCRHLIDSGIASLCWDQYWSVPQQPNLNTLTSKIRALAKKKDPESTFSGEELRNIEIDCNYLDYTWNWTWNKGNYKELQPLINVLPAPRINININTSPEAVKRYFADNLYLNVWPRKPDSTNGSDWIASDPQLSSALKQCAKLRARFLPYFTEGTFIGDCILTKPCIAGRVSAYVLPDRLLIILINMRGDESISLECDLQPWLRSPSGTYTAKSYDSDANVLATTKIASGRWKARTEAMKHLEMTLFEVSPL